MAGTFNKNTLTISIPAVELFLQDNGDGTYTSGYMDGKNAELKRAIVSTVKAWAAEEAAAIASQVQAERKPATAKVDQLREQMEATQRLLEQLLAKVGQ